MKKKVWSKPRLVVLVRGKPAEAVLNGCKMILLSDNPANGFAGCDSDPGCSACEPSAIS